uniref:ELL domain-containing protein n=1 Tax=Mesocestoides corti TaxID=53468 RepID=A0A5K3FUJ6_MESCO
MNKSFESEYKICNGSRDDIEIFHIKLTDSALRTLQSVSHKQSKPIKLTIDGNQGTLAIAGNHSTESFDLSISPLHQSSGGILDFINFQRSRVVNLGKAVSRLTVHANDDSFSAAKLRLSEAEKDQRKLQSKRPLVSNTKGSCFRSSLNSRSFPTPPNSRALDSRTPPSVSLIRTCSPLSVTANKSPAIANAEVGSRQLRDRIIHLLAIQSYQRPELILRLRRDGLTDEQKDQVDAILSKVGRLGRQGEYHLAQVFFNVIEPNWPGYSPSERSTVASLKAKIQSSSPSTISNRPVPAEGVSVSSMTPGSRQNSPLSGIEDFGRKPTRATAPSAPHALGKKIAALDLLSSGIPEATVAAQYGITPALLENWKLNEARLRHTYAQRQGSKMPQSAIPPHSSTQELQKSIRSVTNAAPPTSNTAVKPSAPKRSRLSSDESGVLSGSSSSSTSGNGLSFAPTSSLNHRCTTVAPPSKKPSPPLIEQNRSSSEKTQHSVTCFDGEQTKNSLSRVGSLSNRGSIRRRHHGCGSETSSCGDSSAPSVETSPPPQFGRKGVDANGSEKSCTRQFQVQARQLHTVKSSRCCIPTTCAFMNLIVMLGTP